jgi:LPS-assembly protein
MMKKPSALVTSFPRSCATVYEALLVRKLLKVSILAFLCLPHESFAAQNDQPALIQADNFTYDQDKQIFTAVGNVDLEQDEQIVKADKMIYDKANDIVYAEGHVVFIDKTGQVYFSDKVKLEQQLKKAMAEQMGLMFADGSRLAARQGIQKDENTIYLEDGVYSPCNLCDDDPHKPPLWQLRAEKIVHDKAAQDVYYHNVKLDAYGYPVIYLPYFSHPDPDVKERSGLLMPKFVTDSKNGFMVRNYYYKNFSPSEDATFELSPSTNSGVVYGVQYRHLWDKSSFNFNASVNHSAVYANGDDNVELHDDKFRGHLFTDGSTQLSTNWTAGFQIQRTFDDYYLKDFDYYLGDVLQDDAYLQYINGRDFANINATFFQDLRPDISQEQPDIFPWVKYNLMGDPNQMWGGRWNVNNESVTLFRDGQQSVSRITTIPEWERRDILPFGLESTVNTKLHTDGYWIRQNSPFDVLPTTDEANIDRTVARFVPSAQQIISYPLIRPGKDITAVVEPKVGLTLAPAAINNSEIPNEDSRDVQIDINNLFDDSRFPGNDQVENGSHVAYGIKMGGYENSNGNSGFLTVGQSYRLTDDNPFPVGSGYEADRSDFVGQLETTFYNRFYTDYRFQFNQENLAAQRHELQATYLNDGIELRTSYIYAQVIEGTGLPENRQQLGFSAAKTLTKQWSASVDTLSDLTGEGGLLQSGVGLQYKNECLRVSARAERDLTDNDTGGADTRFLFSVGLRNLGGYDTPLLQNDPLYQPFGTSKSKI